MTHLQAQLEDALLRAEMAEEALRGLRGADERAASLDAQLARKGAELALAEQRLQVGRWLWVAWWWWHDGGGVVVGSKSEPDAA